MTARIWHKVPESIIWYAFNCGIVLATKLLATAALVRLTGAQLAYGLVHVGIAVGAYVLHARGSFNVALSWSSFFAYLRAVLGFKVLDYLVFTVAFGFFEVHALVSVTLATFVIFSLRYSVVRHALVTRHAREDSQVGPEPEGLPKKPLAHEREP